MCTQGNWSRLAKPILEPVILALLSLCSKFLRLRRASQDVHRAAAEPAGAAAESAAAQLATAVALASAATPLEHAAAVTPAILAALPISLPLSPQPVSAVALVARRSSPTPLLPPDARKSSALWPPCACVGLSAAWRTVRNAAAGVCAHVPRQCLVPVAGAGACELH